MKRRIIAAILSILLVAGLLLSRPTTAKADSWQETIDRYDELFAATDDLPENKFNTLYSVLLSEPVTFLNQLAFRDKETKEYVLYILTGDWVTLGQFKRMIEIVSAQDPAAVYTYSENAFLKDLLYQLESAFYSREQYHRVLKSLFVEVTKHDLPTDSFCRELQLSVVQEPREFIVQLAQEDAEVQDLIIACLQLEPPYNTLRTLVFLKLAQEYNIHREQMDYFTETEMELVSGIIWGVQLHPTVPALADPNADELQQWLTETKPEMFMALNYEILFTDTDSEDADGLMKALIYDTANFVNELAFRDVETKHTVLSILSSKTHTDVQLEQMRICLQQYKDTPNLTISETQLLSGMLYNLDFSYYKRPQPHRDCKIMFAEAVSDSIYERLLPFCDELKIAFIANPGSFIIQLAQEQEFVQEKVISFLCSESQISDALLMNVVNTWALERKNSAGVVGYYTEEEFALLQQFSQHLQMVPNEPKLFEPDPEEYQQWLAYKGLLTDDPGTVLPIRPTETQPVTSPTETAPTEETAPLSAGNEHEKDTGWITTVCFALGFLCLGIATGSMIAKKKRSKKAAQAEKQAAAEVPVKIYPKLLYCPAPLSRETQKQISQVLREKYDEYSVHWYSIKQPDGTCRCYGTEGGYDIIFYAGGLRMEIPDSCTVGECSFLFETSFELYAHKDGQLLDLNTALEQGLISHQAVKDALAKHESISK